MHPRTGGLSALGFALCLALGCSSGGDGNKMTGNPVSPGDGDHGGDGDAQVLDGGHDGGTGRDGGPRHDGGGGDGDGDAVIDSGPPWVEPPPPVRETPSCVGSVAECDALSSFDCSASQGCYLAGDCHGVSTSCYSLYNSYSCRDQEGCTWNTSTNRCSGFSWGCDLFSGPGSCGSQEGCYWVDRCAGSAVSCASHGSATCTSQTGCSLTCEAGMDLCDGECVDLQSDVDNCGECGFECGAHSRCNKGVCECGSLPHKQCDGHCVDLDNDVDNCGACGNSCGGGYACDRGKCVDINECQGGACRDGRSCTNTQGGVVCGPCGKGLSEDGAFGCVDIDECQVNHGGCDSNAPCNNTWGSYSCGPCPSGFTGTGDTKCKDIDECATNHGGCRDGRVCINQPGYMECSECPSGYYAPDAFSCQDIDECTNGSSPCDYHTTCTNRAGGFDCSACPSGYSGTGSTGCTDINECLTDNGGCNTLRYCQNYQGSRSCGDCPSGYTNDGDTGCRDVDECAVNNGGCDAHRPCINTTGSNKCGDCSSGFTNYGDYYCLDIDECRVDNGGCDAHSTCTNTVGSRTCSVCAAGYTGSGETGCTDIDECATNNGGCDPLRSCINTAGSSYCGNCTDGYEDKGSGQCIPKLTGVVVSKPATMDPPLDSVFRPYSEHIVEWAPFGGSPTIAFVVADGVHIKVNGQEVASRASIPALAADGSSRVLKVELTGSNGATSQQTFTSQSGCGLRPPSDDVGFTPGGGASVAVSASAILSGSYDTRMQNAQTHAELSEFASWASPMQFYPVNVNEASVGIARATVAMDGDLFAIGFPAAEMDASTSAITGQVQVNRRRGVGSYESRILGPYRGGYAGASLALHGELLAVSSLSDADNLSYATIYRINDNSVDVENSIDVPGRSTTLAWSGEQLLIGTGTDAVKTYVHDAHGWGPSVIIDRPADSTSFGTSIAYGEQAGVLVIGAPRLDLNLSAGDGRAHVYGSAGDGYPPLYTLEPPAGVSGPQFGQAVAVGDHWLAVGSPGNAAGTETGSVSIYWLGEHGPELCSTLQGQVGSHYGAAVAGSGAYLAIGAPDRNSVSAYTVGQWNLLPEGSTH